MRAVIDVGSNSVRMMTDTPQLVHKKEVITTMLAENLAHSGLLCEQATKRTLDAIKTLCESAKRQGADEILIFATEAVRSARNGEQFVSLVKRHTGLSVDVIDGATEAKLGLMGLIENRQDELTVIDIGGASVEVIRGNADGITYSKSLPLGVVRLLDRVGENRSDIEAFVQSAVTEYGFVSGTEGVAIGGTATSLASIDLRQKVYDPQTVHGHVLSARVLDDIIDMIFSSSDRMRDFPTLDRKRARVIGHGAIMLYALMEYLGLSYVTVSERDNMEGYLLYADNKK